MKFIRLIIIICLISACSSVELVQEPIQHNIGSAEIRTTIEAYNKAKIAGLEVTSSTVDGKENTVEIRDGYVFIGRKENMNIGLHKLQYTLFAKDTVITETVPNFPIREGQTTIYYDESFLVDIGFDIIIDPSFDREYEVDFQL